MNLLEDIITYIRRIIKSPSNAQITDALLIDYINRFWLMDVDARIQLFDLKTKYQFQTTPGWDQYNMPLYDLQNETSPAQAGYSVAMFPVYQGFFGPAYVNGIEMPFYTERNSFFNLWPSYNQVQLETGVGNGTNGPYTLQLPYLPNSPGALNFPSSSAILPGHIDINGIISLNNSSMPASGNVDPPLDLTGSGSYIPLIPTTSVFPGIYFTATSNTGANTIVSDTGIFLASNQQYGLLMSPGAAPYGNDPLPGGYLNSFSITGATQANPAVLTATTTLAVGQTVLISGVIGMTQLNGNTYTVTANGGTTVTLNVNSTGFTAYVSGGTISSMSNLINYQTGIATNVFFPDVIPNGNPIGAQCVYYQTGIPRAVLFYNNTITLRAPPNTQYLIELGAYLTPAAFFNSAGAIPYGYMAEYIARGAARKILSDTGDWDQFMAYEPLFKEQESLVHIRSQRQWTSTRSETIYSQQGWPNTYNNSSFGV